MSNEPTQTSRAWLGWMLAFALLCYSSGLAVQLFRQQNGVDFYHYWGIGAARAASADELGTPWASAPRYAGVLNGLADRSSDGHFKNANAQRRSIDPTGTPLFYAAFALLPSDYSRAHVVFRALEFAAGATGVAGFALLLGVSCELAWILGFGALAFFAPFQSDLQVGNVNGLQLCAVTALTLLAQRVVRSRAVASRTLGSRAVVSGALLAALAALFALFKPNLAPLAAGFAALVVVSLGAARGAVALLAGAAVGVLAIAWSSAYFGSARAWLDWYDFLYGANAAKLADYPIEDGNWSAAVVFVDRAKHANYAELRYFVSLAIAAALCVSAAIAVVLGARGAGVGARLRALASRPELIAVATLVAVLAASPLVWFHYGVLALAPILWCLTRASLAARAIGAFAFAAYGCLAAPHLDAFGIRVPDYVPELFALGWIPLWCAVLAELAHRDRAQRA